MQTVTDNKTYYLDATDKFHLFGQVSVRTLNGEARVINFKEKSLWVKLKPKYRFSTNISAKLTLDKEATFTGNLVIKRDGYYASTQRKKISLLSEATYLEGFEDEKENIEVDNYSVKNIDNLKKPIQENFTIRLDMKESLGNKIRINPFLFDRIRQNPFKLKERNYPVDYAYSRIRNYFLSLEIPENYSIVKLPADKAISLPNNGGNFILKTIKNGNNINIITKFKIAKQSYSVEEYYALKEFYKQIIILENGYIILEKK